MENIIAIAIDGISTVLNKQEGEPATLIPVMKALFS